MAPTGRKFAVLILYRRLAYQSRSRTCHRGNPAPRVGLPDSVFGIYPPEPGFSSRHPLSSIRPKHVGCSATSWVLWGSQTSRPVHEGRALLASPSVPEAPSASGRHRDLDAPAIRPSVMPGSPTPRGALGGLRISSLAMSAFRIT
jgi:hypothetical protein